MDKIREKVSDWLGYFKDYVNYFQIVDQQKNVIYFTKFTLDIKEFYEIHNFVLTLKLNIFHSLIEAFKYCVNNILVFEDKNLSEREKVMVIYSACFLNYYKKFLYDINHNFEEFYDDNFFSLIKTNFKFEITNLQLFKVFCFTFFEKMKEEIKNLNYEQKIKPLKHTYNPKINNSNYTNIINILFGNNNGGSNLGNNNQNDNSNNINSINQINNEDCGIKEQAITYLVSAKERMVDLVFEMKYKGIFPNVCSNEINRMNMNLLQLGNISAEELHNLNNFQKNKKIDNNSLFKNDNNNSIYDDKTSTNFNETINRSFTNFNDSMNRTNTTFNESLNSILTDSSNINIYSNNNINQINSINNVNNMNNMNNINININNINTINQNNLNENNRINMMNTNNINSNNINSININNNNINNINLSNNSAFKPNQNINLNNSSEKTNINMYSQRLMNELIKEKVDEQTLEIIKNVAKKIDEKFLDFLLNYSQKPIRIIKYFSCYVAEFTPEMLQNIEPKYKDNLKNVCIRFIILAKELYNTTMELFCSMYDLSYNKVERFVDLAGGCGIQLKNATGLYKVFKDYSIILLEKGSFNDLKKTVEKFVEKEKVNWDKVINQFSDKFPTYFQG